VADLGRPHCDDGAHCTEDLCSAEEEECSHTPKHDLCGEGRWCDPSAPDADEDGCVSAPGCEEDPEICDDGLACNGQERCIDGRCVSGGTVSCPSDPIDCTVEFCREPEGECVSEPRDDLCWGERGPCSLEGCDPVRGCNPPAPDGTPCDEVFFCVVGERCNRDGECDPATGALLLCEDDGNPCTVELCEEESAGCVTIEAPCGVLDGCCQSGCNDLDCCDPLVSDNRCPPFCSPENDFDCCRRDGCGVEDSDGCCPVVCSTYSDPDCRDCESQPCSTTDPDRCCPTDCTPHSDFDCCQLASCSNIMDDGCCPEHCTGSSDADCFEP
jgi:hypothetical protein